MTSSNFTRRALQGASVFGGALVGLAVAACSSDNSKTPVPDGGTGVVGNTSTGGAGAGGAATGGSTSAGGAGGAAGGGSTGSGGTDSGSIATVLVTQTNLVADLDGVAQATDPNLVNPWGLVANPAAGFFWVSDNGTGLATVYAPTTGAVSVLNVKVPGPAGVDGGFMSTPSGQVFNASATDFKGDKFIIDTEDGTISGWQAGTAAVLRVDASTTSEFKGLALIKNGSAAELLAADFKTGKVDAFDSSYKPIANPGFIDAGSPAIPADFAPFNVAALNGEVYVTYAKQKGDGDDLAGDGNGYVSAFKTDGTFMARLVSQGELNSPWGLAIAPASWGALAGTLLVGNFGNGAIHAYDATTGDFKGVPVDSKGPVVIPGLWALVVGSTTPTDLSSSVYFTAGPGGEAHGVFGKLDVSK